jgi:6-phosphofructokinase
VIGTARCDEFREWEGMKKAVRTLVHHRISKLVVIGGDGSLTVSLPFILSLFSQSHDTDSMRNGWIVRRTGR